ELMLIKLCQPLSPSQNDSGVGEGQLKPIAAFTQPAAAKTSVAQTAPVAKVEVKNPETPKSQAPRPAPYNVAAQPQSTVAEPRVNTANFTPKLRTPGLSLHKTQAAEAQTTAPESVITEKRNTPFTDSTVANLWRAYMHDHGTEHLLINIMRNCTPSKTDECLYRVEIENEVQLGLFNDHLADINGYMRDNLANDSFSLEAVIKDGPSSPKTWTEREVLAHMKSTNPEFNAFVDEFKLTLL
ncbi:MAG: hypothetical protein K2K00_09865, partial [Muribaculaceae bacterium]|nr:hypothetical protein [Muribaculaceae bacterium]